MKEVSGVISINGPEDASLQQTYLTSSSGSNKKIVADERKDYKGVGVGWQ